MADRKAPGSARATVPRGAEGGPGMRLVSVLHALLRTARVYRTTNDAFRQVVAELIEVVSSCGEDEATLLAAAGFFYFNGQRVRPGTGNVSVYHALLEELDRRGLGGLRILCGVTPPEVESFVQLFLAARDAAAGDALPARTAESGLLHIVPVRTKDLPARLGSPSDDDGPAGAEAERAERGYWQAVRGSRRILQGAARTGRAALREARRVVQPLVDAILREEHSIVGLTALKDHDVYTYAHCVNVSVLSMGIGNALELPREVLVHLGVAALLHDVGKVAVPAEVLRKSGSLTEEEWRLMRRHPIEGVKMLTRTMGVSSLALDAMQVCLEHHLKWDHTGYPTIDRPWSMTTLSRIVAVADCFDAMTAHRSYRPRPYSPYEALALLLGTQRAQFDPMVLWGLVRCVGVYPAGTVLQVESGHLLLVVGPNPRDAWHPRCRVLAWPAGPAVQERRPELWDPLPEGDPVVRVLAPEEIPFDTGGLLAA